MNLWASTGGRAATTRLGKGRSRLAVLASLVFLLSILLQYASFVGSVAAVHDEGIFELDGNALDQGGVDGDDWENGTPGAADTLFIPGSVEKDGPDTTYFKEGGSKDHHDLDDWAWSGTDVAPDKDELLDVFAAVYEAGDTLVYFGADKFDDSGDAQIGFWFFQDKVSLDSDGSFNGLHTEGDVLILSDFTNGGVVDLICVYEWNPPGDDIADEVLENTGCDIGNNVTLVAAGAECDVSTPDGEFDVCAFVNNGDETAPWNFENKDGDDSFAKGQFFEGGINLSQLFGGDAPCFSTFLAETRSSQEVEAQLKDFALGSLDTCVPPDLKTKSSVSEADFGSEVTDKATLEGSHGAVKGKIDFFICTPDQVTASGCEDDDAAQVGSSVTIVDGEAISAAYTVGLTSDAVGTYCWRAEYTPSDDSEYLPTSHTNATSECFEVAPASIDVEKEADDASVNAGEQIGFTVTVTNTGHNTALGVSFTDALPGGAGVDWTIDAANSDAGWSISGSPQSESLVFSPTSLAAGASATVHIVSNTTKLSCGEYDNTASVTTTNDGSDEAKASTEVLCAEIDVEKEADDASVNAGEQIGFTVTLSNDGDGLATGLAFTDNLPDGDGVSWTIDAANSDAGWSISGSAPNQSLVYAPTTLAAHSSTSVHIVSSTTADSCGEYDNTASVTTGNDGSDEASASTEVLCADIDVEKEADDASVNAGDQIGFTVTLSNDGEGDATGLAFTDSLPGGAGVDWTIESQSGGFSISGSPQTESLVFAPTSLAAGASAWVHVVSNTTAASCGKYDNTASVTTGNDGSDEASASTDVLCGQINVEKTADAPSVNAGEQIGFIVTLTNSGEGLITGLAFTDNLPGGDGVSWSVDAGNSDAGWSITGSAPNQALVYTPTTLGAGISTKVHVVSDTTADSCGEYDNTASVTTGNDGDDEASASTDVLCAEIDVEKAADAASVEAGEQIGFTVTLSNDGEGLAKGLAFADTLPGGAGISWSIETQSGGFSITGTAPNQSLVYAPTTLAAGASAWVHIVSATTADSCGQYDNTASVTTTNDGSDEASDSTFVECPVLAIEKSVAESGFDAVGQVLHYTIKVTNVGNVMLLNVVVTDPLVSDLDCEPDLPVPSLAVGASFTCTATYTIVEADFDSLLVTNVACADDGMGDGEVGANPVCDDVSTPGQELQEETDAPTLPPTQPPTDGVLRGSTSAPSDGAWLLVIGLAIGLSLLVFMTPARKRSRM
jgi:uncharacterized repeat protein (TIGR01451 family)